MDPAVVDSAEFGLLWKVPFNAKEQVRQVHLLRHIATLWENAGLISLVLRETIGVYSQWWKAATFLGFVPKLD